MDLSVLWRAAAVQVAGVVVISLALAALLPHDFFEDWGWVSGPVAWLACAAVTARVLSLPMTNTLLGAVIAGLLSGVAVLAGVHWLGVAIAIGVFAVWCARTAGRGAAPGAAA